ncbi:Arm DNA-binding domain-containing protein [Achromobacter insuavis]|uniref:Arm DNA-binding domain-containing protein n=1 Tax=Achromobacter insuavis TaxID=1287735 RepID=UPI003CC812B7
MGCTWPSLRQGPSPSDTNYCINGRRETLTLGRYGFGGISLAAARDKRSAVKRLVRDGISPAIQKHCEKAPWTQCRFGWP